MARKLVIVLSGLLVLAVAGIWLFPNRDRRPTPSQPVTTPSPTIASVLPELSAFVERERGLQFLKEVRIRVVPEPQLGEQLKNAADPVDVSRAGTVLTVLGLLPPEADLAAIRAASDRTTGGFYDPAGNELVIGNRLTPLVRRTLVHELTHALDDQHFGIDREIPGDDAAVAFKALVEGNAIRVERLYVSSLPAAEQEQIQAEEEGIRAGDGLPPAVEQLLDFPHLFGPPFVDALLEEGAERLDEAFKSPPASTEQVLDPARYLSGDAPQAVRPPRTEGAVIDEGEIGPTLLRLALESKLDRAAAEEAARGWDGDRYATWWSPDGRTCIRAQFAVDTPEDSRQLEAALEEWVKRTTDREVDSAGLLLKACSKPE